MEEKKKSGLATAGLVLGIVAICTSFIPIINNLSFFMGAIALIFGIISIVKKAGVGKSIAAIILGVLSIVITLAMQKSFGEAIDKTSKEIDKVVGNSTESVLGTELDVDLGEFQVIKGEFIDETKMVVKLTNKTNQSKSFNVQVEAVDQSGSRIESDYIYASNLGAGQSQQFEIFHLIQSEKIESMKNATFKIVQVSSY